MSLRHWISRVSAALGIGLTSSCAAVPPEPELVEITAAAPEPVPIPSPGPALWRVSDEDTTIYLFGTIHALPESADWYDPRIQRAFAASDELVTEIDMGDPSAVQAAFAERSTLSGGRNLRELMTREDRVEYESALTSLGVPLDVLDAYEPWYAALNLTVLPLAKSGYDADAGVDQILTEYGGSKRRAALETVYDQLELLDGLPMAAQLAMLDGAVEAVPSTAHMLGEMVERWLQGDAEGLAALLNADMEDPALHSRLFDERNARWVDWIDSRMAEPGTVFMAVGAGHLAGAGSVQDILERRGREVTRVWQ